MSNIKNILRELRLKAGKLLLDKKSSDNFSDNLPMSILFLRQDGKIGDYIVSSFAFREIKRFNPTIKIGVVCTKQNAYLFEQNPYIDQLYFVKKKNIFDYIKCGLKLRKEHYDLVIDPTIMIRNRDLLLLRLIKAKNYFGFHKEDYKLFNLNLSQQDIHFSEVYRKALEKIGITIDNIKYDIPNTKVEDEEIKYFLQTNQIRNYIAINFYGASSSRKFSDERIKQILQYITSIILDKHIIILSYPEVTNKLRTIAKEFKNVFVHNTQNIFHTISLIKYCDQLISPDTSSVHIASGFNKPIIGIYSEDKTNFTHWKPISEKVNILFYQNDINEINPEQFLKKWFECKLVNFE
ncbi:glycosyltransferase family 9 protein [Avibacterium paragallinarum]|uniref:glycosyltransferase family 9 protein n=4 Tax=Avibacterium paragallinarum TaxID=728 RepID=UPI00021ACFD4|nr:glycosyltransferase family 9 protein [Avibacterium paragallinarum]AZI14121.1 lipopolysaccharide heptosyltransferase family protein [Avibacterium paragallinarum]QIR11589.1 glycosyltransferase family 9 protein [Avibacterium paragallinarum]QJE09437.1 glycosyltransferase family 9 protein [Avibacterium paragallinarum]QJE11633.1 glycosyltransferase family 9 protein [Avibacterium paragallinarum]QJE13832.1 glycosyltransferase family 9 protein [Avibacterium paragallinarum]